jgi:hypothetical protein
MSDRHKQMARRLRADLATRDVTISHGEALELNRPPARRSRLEHLSATSSQDGAP